jgi:uncharacterized membrane protein
MSQPLEYEQAFYNAPDGGQVGKTSTDKIAFLGATPTAVSTIVVAGTSTAPVSTSGIYGFTQTQAQSIIAAVLELQRKGLIA